MTPVMILVGAAMLFFGRRLFWVFVAGLGFVCGALVAADFLVGQEAWLLLALALVGGLLGALLALFAQKFAIGVAGFLAAGYLAHTVAENLGHEVQAWIAFLVAGVLGAILVLALFDWALIVLSSLTGAAVISQEVPWTPPWPAVVFLVLLVFGLAFQSRQWRAKSAMTKPRKP